MLNQINIAIVCFVFLAFAGFIHYLRLGKRKDEHYYDFWAN